MYNVSDLRPLAIGMVICAFALTATGREKDHPIEAHPETQVILAKWVQTANRDQAEEHYVLLASMQPLAAKDYRRFVEQVMYFVDHMEQREKPRAGIVRSVLYLCLVPHGEVAAALSGHLYSDHAEVRKEAWKLFPSILGSGLPDASPDLSHIRDRVTGDRQQEDVATPLKRAIFEVAPHQAFRLFLAEAERMEGIRLMRAQRTMDNALFERNIVTHERGYLISAKERGHPDGALPVPPPWKLDETTIAALRELATSKHWWARMFASEFMYHNKEFRVEELIEKLEQDENDLVRQSAASIKTPDPLRAPVGPLRP